MKNSVRAFYNFLEYPSFFYDECKKFKFYNIDEFKKKHNEQNAQWQWPGMRTSNFSDQSPFLHMHLLLCLKNSGIDIHKYKKISSYAHVRTSNDESKDWPHVDDCDTALIYLSNTNLDSGTVFLTDQKEEITRVNFLQNTCVFFEQGLLHSSFGNHGDTIDNARMTLNIFLFK